MLPRRLPIAALILVLGSCATPAPKTAPPANVRPTPVRPAPAPPPPTTSDWRDWPVTPGDWRYGRTATGSTANYATSFALTCDFRTRRVAVMVHDGGGQGGSLTVRTSSTQRTLPVAPVEGWLVATLAGTDPLLDAMGFSRGRFVIEQAGVRPLVIPAWAEILRVTEDCRG